MCVKENRIVKKEAVGPFLTLWKSLILIYIKISQELGREMGRGRVRHGEVQKEKGVEKIDR